MVMVRRDDANLEIDTHHPLPSNFSNTIKEASSTMLRPQVLRLLDTISKLELATCLRIVSRASSLHSVLPQVSGLFYIYI